ncbi:MAG: hypothetical protein KGJ56_00255 [Gammaproteobacteria bacterium]|nr:hypothetical protein [Gammaproteobacteria bacterium]
MGTELTEVLWLDEHSDLPLTRLAELSGLSEAELHELTDYGVLPPADPDAAPLAYRADCIVIARTARRLRDELELDVHGLALILTLLDRVHDLEAQLCDLRARQPRRIR